jgi:hypothetical protein
VSASANRPTTRWLAIRLGAIYVALLIVAYLISGASMLVATAIVGAIVLPIAAAAVRWGRQEG